MPSAYPYELRVRVIRAIESKMPIVEVMRVFNVCRDTVYKWKALKENTGDMKAKTGYQSGFSRMKVKDLGEFKSFIDKHGDKSLPELAKLYPGSLSESTIANYLRRISYTYKKSLLPSQKGH